MAALFLIEEDQRLNVHCILLSPKAKAGSWFHLDIVGGQARNIKLDDKETDLARQRIAEKIARL